MATERPVSDDPPPQPVSHIRSLFEGIAARNTNSPVVPPIAPRRIFSDTVPKAPPPLPQKPDVSSQSSPAPLPDLTQALKRAPPPPPPPSASHKHGLLASSKPQVLTPSPIPAEVPSRQITSAPPVPLRTPRRKIEPVPASPAPQNGSFIPSSQASSPARHSDTGLVNSAAHTTASTPPPISHHAPLDSDVIVISHSTDDIDHPYAVQEAVPSTASLQRKPPPPPSKRPFAPSRPPSPQPGGSPRPVLPLRPSKTSLTVNSDQDLVLSASAVPMLSDAEDSSSNAATSNSSAMSKSNSAASSAAAPDEPVTDPQPYPGIGERRGSMPVSVLRHGQLDAQPSMERSATEQAVTTKGTLPPMPPPRMGLGGRPLPPPRPAVRNITPTQHLAVPSPTGSPTPPPLPSRTAGDRNSMIVSDDDASSSSAATAVASAAPPPPPRRIVDAMPHAAPPPSHPGLGLGRSPTVTHLNHGRLHGAFNKVKNALPLTHGIDSRGASGERPRTASGNIKSQPHSPAFLERERQADSPTGIDATPLPPPPVRSIAIGDRLPVRRSTAKGSPTGSADDDVDSASSSGIEDNDGQSTNPTHPNAGTSSFPSRHRTIDDVPDSSRSNRRPPFAAGPSRDGEALRVHAPHKSVSALAGGILCIGRHELAVYDLSSVENGMADEQRRRGHKKQRSEPPLPSVSPPPQNSSSLPRPKFFIDLKDVKGLQYHVDDPIITAMEFAPVRPGGDASELCRYLWCGTRDGSLWEMDTLTGDVTAIAPAAHRAPIMHILRYKTVMVTIDEGGKALVYGTVDPLSPQVPESLANDGAVEEGWTDVGHGASLLNITPRVLRVADKQGFARILYGKLWTSSGSSSSENAMAVAGSAGNPSASGPGSTSAAGKGPIVRIYDIFNTPLPSRENSDAASMTAVSDTSRTGSHIGKAATLLSTEPGVGAVTSGTVLIKTPGLIYLGHEGGYVTIWEASPTVGNASTASVGTESSSTTYPPKCIQTLKIASTDILCLEGIHSRLWAGARNGFISVYDVESRPWTLTNTWKHAGADYHMDDGKNGLPVYKLMVDVVGMAHREELLAVSVGRDEMVRCWDGFLSANWIDAELQKHEASFSTFRPVNILICTWNVDAAKPETLNKMGNGNGNANLEFFDTLLSSVDSPDIIVFGFQEVIDLESRKLTAKTVLLGSNNAHKVSRAYKLWNDRLVYAVRLAMPADCPYSVIHTENLVGLFSCIFIKNSVKETLKDMAITTVKRGMGGHYGNKGAIVSRFVIDDSSFCFINCHLAAGQSHKAARNQDLAAVLEEKSTFRDPIKSDGAVVFAGGGDGSMILDHEFVFLNGDLNYRIDQRRDAVLSNIRAGEFHYLLTHDQLLKEMKTNRGFRLRTFHEAPITFAPTYKYDRNSNDYDSSEKRRIPAWCDRILYRCRDPTRVDPIHYKRYEVNVSDHRPVSAAFVVKAKKVDYNARREEEDKVKMAWAIFQQDLISEAIDFYTLLGFF